MRIQKTTLAENAGKGNVEFNKNVKMEMISLEILFTPISFVSLYHKHFKYVMMMMLLLHVNGRWKMISSCRVEAAGKKS